MTATRSHHPIALEQKHALVATYRANGGNMSRAMAAAGIASRRTAYLWWHRYQAGGVGALEPHSHARMRRGRVADPLAARICQLNHEHPRWGRRRIAMALAREDQNALVSPSGVEAVLRRNDRWIRKQTPEASTISARCDLPSQARHPIDLEKLFAHVRQGLDASLQSRARAAMHLLWRGVWLPFREQTGEYQRLLSDSRVGPWILRGWIQLGHSLMNVGDWLNAQQVLHLVMAWLDEHEPPLGRREYEGPTQGFSLHWNDLWFESYLYLGIVWRETNSPLAASYLSTARQQMELAGRRGRPPTNYQGSLANLERDTGKLKLHRLKRGCRVPISDIAGHVVASQRARETEPDAGMCAATEILRAQLQSVIACANQVEDRTGWRAALDEMQVAVARSLDLARNVNSPMLKAMFAIDAAELYERHAMHIDAIPLIEAAQFCSKFGYGRQARKLLRLNACVRLVPEEVRDLVRQRFP